MHHVPPLPPSRYLYGCGVWNCDGDAVRRPGIFMVMLAVSKCTIYTFGNIFYRLTFEEILFDARLVCVYRTTSVNLHVELLRIGPDCDKRYK